MTETAYHLGHLLRWLITAAVIAATMYGNEYAAKVVTLYAIISLVGAWLTARQVRRGNYLVEPLPGTAVIPAAINLGLLLAAGWFGTAAVLGLALIIAYQASRKVEKLCEAGA